MNSLQSPLPMDVNNYMTVNMRKILSGFSWKSLIYLSVSMVLLFVAFYWCALRPSEVKSKCSWFTYTEPEQPAKVGLSAEEAQRRNEENRANNPAHCATSNLKGLLAYAEGCAPTNFTAEASEPAIPAKTITRNATDKEYQSCLRHHGL